MFSCLFRKKDNSPITVDQTPPQTDQPGQTPPNMSPPLPQHIASTSPSTNDAWPSLQPSSRSNSEHRLTNGNRPTQSTSTVIVGQKTSQKTDSILDNR